MNISFSVSRSPAALFAALAIAAPASAFAQDQMSTAPLTPAAAPAETQASAPTQAPAPAATPAPAAAPAAAPAETAAGAVPAPPSGKGQVVFFRPWAYPGLAVSFTIHEGQTGVGKLGNASYFIYVGAPGAHTFTVQSEATDTLNMEIDPGETYYVKETLGMGLLLYRPHLTPSDEATFTKLKLKVSTKTPTDLKSKDDKSEDAKSGGGR